MTPPTLAPDQTRTIRLRPTVQLAAWMRPDAQPPVEQRIVLTPTALERLYANRVRAARRRFGRAMRTAYTVGPGVGVAATLTGHLQRLDALGLLAVIVMALCAALGAAAAWDLLEAKRQQPRANARHPHNP